MSTRIGHRPRRPDRGATLVELLVAVALVGVLIGPITMGIVVVLRSTTVSSESVSQSQDLRQIVNYLPADARSGSLQPSSYKTSIDSDRGSGCDPAGNDNVLVIEPDADSSNPRIAYALSGNPDGTARLDRFECDPSDDSIVGRQTVADSLVDDGVTAPASSQLVLAETSTVLFVERIELRLAQNNGVEVVSAAPLEESALPAVSTGGECSGQPLDAALGFTTFAREGDVRLGGGQTKISTAIGGSLSWSGSTEIGKNATGPNGIGLYVDTVDWSTSSGTLRMPGGAGDLVIRNSAGTTITTRNGIPVAHGPAGPSGPSIEVQGGVARFADPGDVIDFDAQFETLIACSQKLAQLPNSCTTGNNCAEHVELRNQNDTGPFEGSGNHLIYRIHPTKANVLNIPTVAKFESLPQNMNFRWKEGTGGNGQAKIDPDNPLIVTIIEGGDLVITAPWNSQNSARYILYNFPNATSVTFTGSTTWGTVIAPKAQVEIDHNGQFQGGLVARTFVQGSVELNAERNFAGTIDWDA